MTDKELKGLIKFRKELSKLSKSEFRKYFHGLMFLYGAKGPLKDEEN